MAAPLPAPPADPGWDIRFTRLMQAVRTPVEACAIELARRFLAFGLGCEMHVRPTPRGLSIFLARVGWRGLICIVDFTLVDGIAAGLGPHAALDVRLLDACGDVVAEGLAHGLPEHARLETGSSEVLVPDHLDRLATSVYMTTLMHFELPQPAA